MQGGETSSVFESLSLRHLLKRSYGWPSAEFSEYLSANAGKPKVATLPNLPSSRTPPSASGCANFMGSINAISPKQDARRSFVSRNGRASRRLYPHLISPRYVYLQVVACRLCAFRWCEYRPVSLIVIHTLISRESHKNLGQGSIRIPYIRNEFPLRLNTAGFEWSMFHRNYSEIRLPPIFNIMPYPRLWYSISRFISVLKFCQ